MEKETRVEPMKCKPSLSIDAEEFPDIKGAKLGQKFKLYVTAKLISLNQDEYSDKQTVSGRLEIQKIENEDFEDKNYSDIVNEDMEKEGDE